MTLRSFLKAPLRLALRNEWFRKVLTYELRTRHFGDLGVHIPLSPEFSCPILQDRYVWSFSEIFVANEYGDFLTDTRLPARWIDLGCHAGFFSLYLAWQHMRAGNDRFEGLLIDADPRVGADVARLLAATKLSDRLRFAHGAIGSGGALDFALRDRMASSAADGTKTDAITRVPVLSASDLLEAFPPPYDLIKLDIEGGEGIFFDLYDAVVRNAAHIVVEWHAWNPEGGEAQRLRGRMTDAGFAFQRELQPQRTHLIDGRTLHVGCHVYRNVSPVDRVRRVAVGG